jgi:O-methyltransferase domain
MLQMLNAFLTVQALHVVAALGIPDRVADGPAALDDLAAATGAHPTSLYRVLRMLVGAGVFREEKDQRFALGPLGRTLCSEGPDSVRDWALYVGATEPWNAWGRLRETVMTGQSGFMLEHSMSTYEYLVRHPDLGAPFDRWMTRQSDQHNGAVVAAYDFSGFRTVADVGGGQGSTLAAILRANSSLRGILLDQPQVVAGAQPVLRAAGVADRCEVLAGDMRQGVPRGADAYMVKRVLMLWGNEPAILVLRHCAEALPEDGRVLVVEMVMPPSNDPSPARSFDLLMLLANEEGRVRTEAEFRDLFAAAGLRLARVISTASPNFILEGVRA